jgi:hypothetical protein
MAFLCVSQQWEFKKKHKKRFGESPCQKLLAEEVEKKNFFPGVFPIDFFIALLAVSLHERPKNTTIFFPKTRPENLKKSGEKK